MTGYLITMKSRWYTASYVEPHEKVFKIVVCINSDCWETNHVHTACKIAEEHINEYLEKESEVWYGEDMASDVYHAWVEAKNLGEIDFVEKR